ncbi:MAG: arsenate reductase [Acidobacteria bacterium]|nr:arsenate reductase [Acidobacteriota bacterium]
MLILIGIPNCDSVKKARKELDAKGITYTFRDFRKEPLSAEEWFNILQQDIQEKLLNRKGTTYRQLQPEWDPLSNEARAQVLAIHPTLAKRPIILANLALASIGLPIALP